MTNPSPPSTDELALYLHLAWASQVRRRPLVSDRFLVLAAVSAARLGLDEIANGCRQRVLVHNPGHYLRRFETVAAALLEPDFALYFQSVERRLPREKAEHMLDTLGLDLARERALYASDEEYAAALMQRLSGPAPVWHDPTQSGIRPRRRRGAAPIDKRSSPGTSAAASAPIDPQRPPGETLRHRWESWLSRLGQVIRRSGK